MRNRIASGLDRFFARRKVIHCKAGIELKEQTTSLQVALGPNADSRLAVQSVEIAAVKEKALAVYAISAAGKAPRVLEGPPLNGSRAL